MVSHHVSRSHRQAIRQEYVRRRVGPGRSDQGRLKVGFAASEVARRKRDKCRRTDSLLVRVCRRDCSYLDEWGIEDGIFDRMAAGDADWEG